LRSAAAIAVKMSPRAPSTSLPATPM
jgi:hypothetical protein